MNVLRLAPLHNNKYPDTGRFSFIKNTTKKMKAVEFTVIDFNIMAQA